MMKYIAMSAFTIAAMLPTASRALTLNEFYMLEPSNRAWYLGGIYDSNIIDTSSKGERSECLSKLGLQGFTQLLSKFVTSLPSDPASSERRTFDSMNVALISALEIDKNCGKDARSASQADQK